MTYNTALKLLAFAMLGLPMLRADAFLDVNGVFTTIAVPGAEPGTTVASSINNLGQIAGSFINSSGVPEGFVDTNGVFTTFSNPGPDLPDARLNITGINDSGQMVGNFNTVATSEDFLYRNGVYSTLVQDATVAGINDSGEIIVTGPSAGFFASEIITANGGLVANLIIPGALSTDAAGITGHGPISEVVGSAFFPGTTTFWTWTNGVFTTINLPGSPTGINNFGQIIGNAGGFGYLDTSGVIQTIDVPGSTGTVAYGINDAGDIVGTFTPAVVPEPASLLLAAAGLTGIALLKRYRAAPWSCTVAAPRK